MIQLFCEPTSSHHFYLIETKWYCRNGKEYAHSWNLRMKLLWKGYTIAMSKLIIFSRIGWCLENFPLDLIWLHFVLFILSWPVFSGRIFIYSGEERNTCFTVDSFLHSYYRATKYYMLQLIRIYLDSFS